MVTADGMIALGFLKEERLGLDRALTGQKEMAVVAQEKADAEMAVLAKKNADEARAETVLAQAQETAVVAKENADGARAETVLAQETAVVANEQAGADPEAAVPKETAVVANEKAGANPEAAVPEGNVGMARANPNDARAIPFAYTHLRGPAPGSILDAILLLAFI